MINVCKDSADPWRSCSGKARVSGKLSNITIRRGGESGWIFSFFSSSWKYVLTVIWNGVALAGQLHSYDSESESECDLPYIMAVLERKDLAT